MAVTQGQSGIARGFGPAIQVSLYPTNEPAPDEIFLGSRNVTNDDWLNAALNALEPLPGDKSSVIWQHSEKFETITSSSFEGVLKKGVKLSQEDINKLIAVGEGIRTLGESNINDTFKDLINKFFFDVVNLFATFSTDQHSKDIQELNALRPGFLEEKTFGISVWWAGAGVRYLEIMANAYDYIISQRYKTPQPNFTQKQVENINLYVGNWEALAKEIPKIDDLVVRFESDYLRILALAQTLWWSTFCVAIKFDLYKLPGLLTPLIRIIADRFVLSRVVDLPVQNQLLLEKLKQLDFNDQNAIKDVIQPILNGDNYFEKFETAETKLAAFIQFIELSGVPGRSVQEKWNILMSIQNEKRAYGSKRTIGKKFGTPEAISSLLSNLSVSSPDPVKDSKSSMENQPPPPRQSSPMPPSDPSPVVRRTPTIKKTGNF